MKIPDEFPTQLRLAYDVLDSAAPLTELTPEQKELLRVDPEATLTEIRSAAKDIMVECWIAVLGALPDPETRFDMESEAGRDLTYELLQRIDASTSGSLSPVAVKVPDQVIAFLIEHGVVARGINGLMWGRNAGEFIRRYKQEKSL